MTTNEKMKSTKLLYNIMTQIFPCYRKTSKMIHRFGSFIITKMYRWPGFNHRSPHTKDFENGIDTFLLNTQQYKGTYQG